MRVHSGVCPVCRVRIDDDDPMAHVNWCVTNGLMMHKACRMKYLAAGASRPQTPRPCAGAPGVRFETLYPSLLTSDHGVIVDNSVVRMVRARSTRECFWSIVLKHPRFFDNRCERPLRAPNAVVDDVIRPIPWHRFYKTFKQQAVYVRLVLK